MTAEVLEPESPLARYFDLMEPTVGERTRTNIGVVDRVTIGRFANSIGSQDPLHLDREAARAAGFDDVIAPANFLAAIFEWGVGTPESDLNEDGTPRGANTAIRDLRLRGMGAGERMEMFHPLVAGMDLVLETVVDSVTAKSSRGGPCVFVTTSLHFATTAGLTLNRNERTVVLRNPVDGDRP